MTKMVHFYIFLRVILEVKQSENVT
uniref:Uncharacterized protein n=1 Tax=Arundo donax TaxID=35708 RepID=A0A0A8ZCB5_ARUDO